MDKKLTKSKKTTKPAAKETKPKKRPQAKKVAMVVDPIEAAFARNDMASVRKLLSAEIEKDKTKPTSSPKPVTRRDRPVTITKFIADSVAREPESLAPLNWDSIKDEDLLMAKKQMVKTHIENFSLTLQDWYNDKSLSLWHRMGATFIYIWYSVGALICKFFMG